MRWCVICVDCIVSDLPFADETGLFQGASLPSPTLSLLDATTQHVIHGYGYIPAGEMVLVLGDIPETIALRINAPRATASVSLNVDGASSILHAPGPFGAFGYDNSTLTFNGWNPLRPREFTISVQLFRGENLQGGKSSKYDLRIKFVHPSDVVMPQCTPSLGIAWLKL
jgi:hypothetical protein